jgi:DNA-binding transcriptional ArsR family regulator
VIQLRMSMADLERFRFAYSPLTEAGESLRSLFAERVSPLHRTWYESVRDRLRGIDLDLLAAIVPERRFRADFLLVGASDPATTMETQLQRLAELPVERVRADLEMVWDGRGLPPPAAEVVAAGQSGVRRLADALWQYWLVAVEPHWKAIRSVLDDDVAYRAARLTVGGIQALLADLHPDVSVHAQALRIDKPRHGCSHDLGGGGVLLIPGVFVWPDVIVGIDSYCPPSLTYAARGVGTLWGGAAPRRDEDDALAALLGRSRAAILLSLALPQSTTELAVELGQSAPAVSQHLSVLRRSGLVTSWRSGRRVLYHRTPLATSIVAASAGGAAGGLVKRPA